KCDLDGRKRGGSHATVAQTQKYFGAVLDANKKTPTVSREISQIMWIRPQQGMVKVNCDGSLCRHGRGVGVGIIARDHDGHCIDWLAKFHPGVRDVEHAEALAMRGAIELAQRNNWPNVQFEGTTGISYKKFEKRNWMIL
ncbi:hypothetical protein Salat_0166300, partial [Sesamum alatum]